jgi:leucyl aminopeptidase
MTTLTITTALPAADTVAVFATSDAIFGTVKTAAVTNKIKASLKNFNFAGKQSELVTMPGAPFGIDAMLIVVGVGKNPQHESFRKAAGVAARAAVGRKKLAVVVDEENNDAVGAIAEGILMGAYTFNEFRGVSQSASRESVKACVIVSTAAKNALIKDAINRAISVSDAVNRTRDLANTPPGHLPPKEVAARAKKVATDYKLSYEVLDEKQLKAKGFGGITGVGQGSANPPRLIRLGYKPAKATAHIAIVGKGITFDTGGISIKPHLNMHEMKADMAGAAAVISAIAAIAELKLPVQVTAFAACAENMPGGGAQRPGDVVTAYGGRTVEVLNTDAEGRLVLMDALVRAQEEKPDLIIDVATLTGAAVIALGRRISAVLSPQDAIRNHVVDAASRSGESFWPMPLPAEYRPRLDSQIADIANIAEPLGSTLYGGLFLQDFIKPQQKWAHLDIAAPAFNSEGPFDYTPKGATGTAVRTLVTIVEDVAAGLLKL